MQARVKAGWITEADLAPPAEEAKLVLTDALIAELLRRGKLGRARQQARPQRRSTAVPTPKPVSAQVRPNPGPHRAQHEGD